AVVPLRGSARRATLAAWRDRQPQLLSPMLVYLDGQFLPKEQAKVSVDDRGFLFGDGVYEVTRAVGGKLIQEERHWVRLRNALRGLQLDASHTNRGRIREIYEHLHGENCLAVPDSDATVYRQITRGCALRSHALPLPP